MTRPQAVQVERPTARLLTIEEAGERLGLKRSAAYQLVADGLLPAVKLPLRPDAKRAPLRVREDDLATYMDSLPAA